MHPPDQPYSSSTYNNHGCRCGRCRQARADYRRGQLKDQAMNGICIDCRAEVLDGQWRCVICRSVAACKQAARSAKAKAIRNVDPTSSADSPQDPARALQPVQFRPLHGDLPHGERVRL